LSKGGRDIVKNLAPLHKTCHESVTFVKKDWKPNS
jgi:hypothetical protein